MRSKLNRYELMVMRDKGCDFSFEHQGTTFRAWYYDGATLVQQEDGAGIRKFALKGEVDRETIIAKY